MCAQKMMAMKVNNLTIGCKLKMIDRKPKDHFKCYMISVISKLTFMRMVISS